MQPFSPGQSLVPHLVAHEDRGRMHQQHCSCSKLGPMGSPPSHPADARAERGKMCGDTQPFRDPEGLGIPEHWIMIIMVILFLSNAAARIMTEGTKAKWEAFWIRIGMGSHQRVRSVGSSVRVRIVGPHAAATDHRPL
eukprot:gene15635-biopygen12253